MSIEVTKKGNVVVSVERNDKPNKAPQPANILGNLGKKFTKVNVCPQNGSPDAA
jgi:hypothetical protein